MANIPARENLESMSRTDIQRLCKDNNIKANMRTDEMINALCDLVNGKDVPRPYRSMSERVVSQPPKSRLHSVQPASKPTEVSTKKAALQPSESNTDAESVADIPVSAPTTRRKAKDLQMRLGKGRPVIAGGSGARNITKVTSRGAGRKTKASAMLQEDPIPEEDENIAMTQAPTTQHTGNSNIDKAAHPQSAPTGLTDIEHPHLPAPGPSNPAWTWPSAQFAALELRVGQIETLNLITRLSQVEAALTDIPTVKTSMVQISALQDEIKRLEAGQRSLGAEITRWSNAHDELKGRVAELGADVKELLVENATLKERVTELQTKLHDADKDTSTSSAIVHSPGVNAVGNGVDNDVDKEKDVDKGKGLEKEASVGTVTSVKPVVFASLNSHLPHPSPSRPTLGKRARSPVDTPDISLSELAVDATQKQREDAELAAIYRLIKPQRKKPRLATDPDEDVPPFSFFQHGHVGPASTSTPHQRRSDSPPGFFTAGQQIPTPLVRPADEEDFMSLDIDESAVQGLPMAGPSNVHAADPPHAVSSTPQSKPITAGPSTDTNLGATANSVYDPGFFGGPLPVHYTQESQLPFPLRPATPLNPQDILERSAQLATPILGEPWKFDATVNPPNTPQLGDAVEQPATPGSVRSLASTSNAVAPESPGDYTFRSGGRKERNDKYNPYFTPQRGPGARHRTGITPTRAFSVSLRSPTKMTTVVEAPEAEAEAETKDGVVVRSPPHLRTLYGTELARDTRFGDYGKDLGRYDWAKYVPR